MESHAPESAVLSLILGEPGSLVRSISPESIDIGADLDWSLLCERAAAHGLAPLLLREISARGWVIPDPARATLEHAAEYCRGRAVRCQFTLYRFLEVSARHSLATALLKGAALVGSAYADPRLRAMDDIDLLVRAKDVSRARAVGEEIGLGFGSFQLPAFYYRLTQFASSLQPDLETLVPLDLHWELHSPALLLTDRIERVWERRRILSVYGFPTSVLDPADQWLHLVTHLWSHWGFTPAPAAVPDFAALVSGPGIAVALKWVADLVRATRDLARESAPNELAARAAEWSAEAETAATLALLQPLIAPPALDFAREVAAAVAGAEPPRRGRRSGGSPQAGELVHPALGFRTGSLRRLPGWVFPSERYLRASSGIGRAPVGALTLLRIRVAHAARVLTRAALALALLPAALLGRRLAQRSRERRIRAARTPARVAELLRKFREFEVAYAARFVSNSSGGGGV